MVVVVITFFLQIIGGSVSSIKKIANKHFGALPAPTGVRITRVSLGLIMHAISSSALTKVIKEEVGNQSIMAFKNDLKAGYLIKNVKLWLWASVCQGLTLKQTIRSMGKYEIQPEDKVLARVLFSFQPLLKSIQELAQKFNNKYHTLRKFDKLVVKCVGHCDDSMFNLTKTMNFMIGSYLSREDLKLEFCRYGIYAVYKQYPKIDSFDHCINIYRRGARNSSINMIQQHNSKGRATFVENEDGKRIATLVPIVSIHAFDSTDRSYIGTENQKTNLEGNRVTDNQPAMDFSVRGLQEKATTPKQRDFIKLLSGAHDERFCEWLQENNYTKENDELFDYFMGQSKLGNYVELCTTYLGINPIRARSFMYQLRGQLS